MEGLCGCNENSVSKRSNNETWAVTEVLVTVVELSISNFKDEVLLLFDPVDLKLRLPLEFLAAVNFLQVEFFDDITRVSIHSNHATDLLAHWASQVTLDHFN